jgi:uncharacterized protein YdeI (YjbR/CyaY-like superfamily)
LASKPEPVFFDKPAQFREWLEQNHASAKFLWVGLRRKASGTIGMRYVEALDEALCFGWIDGLVKGIDEFNYMIRFSPRKPDSVWSEVNKRKYSALLKAGRITEAGKAAFARGEKIKPDPIPELDPAYLTLFHKNENAWQWFATQPPWYRRVAFKLVMSAKRAETRERRLQQLIQLSNVGKRLPQVTLKKEEASQEQI